MGMLLRRRYQAEDSEDLSEDTEAPGGTPGPDEGSESTGDATEGQGEGNEPTPPTRNASKADWLAFLGIEDDGRSRDELAESVLGPKQ